MTHLGLNLRKNHVVLAKRQGEVKSYEYYQTRMNFLTRAVKFMQLKTEKYKFQ